MASPLSFFRKHQFAALVAVGVLAIVSFVIIPPIDDYLRSRSSGGGPQMQAVVVTWAEGRVRESDLRSMNVSHNLTMNFLDAMAEETRRRNGQPKAMRLFRNDSEQALVATMLLAEKAQQLGVVISDAAIYDYLERFGDGLFDHRDLNELLRTATGGRLTRVSLFKQLRKELLAHYMRQMAFTGVAASTPAVDFHHFNQLRERLTLELLPLPVSDFVSEVDRQPTDTDLKQLYEQHREDFRNPFRPEPGFRRLPKIDFAFFRADFNTFLEEEQQNITDEQIEAEYEAGKLRGEHRRSGRPSGTMPPGAEGFGQPGLPGGLEGLGLPPLNNFDLGTPPAEPGRDPEPGAASPTEVVPPPAEDTPVPPLEAPPTADEPETPREAPAEPETTEPETTEPETTEPETTEEERSEEERSEEDAAHSEGEDACGPFFFQDDEGDVEEPEVTPGTEPAVPAAQPPAEAATEQPAASTPDTQAAQPADDAAVPVQPDATEPEVTTGDAVAEPAESEFLPLSEVRDQILRKLASPRAQERLTAALEEARRELENYFQAYTIWKQQAEFTQSGTEAEPQAPNWQALAERLGFTFGTTGLVDVFEVAETELGDTVRFDAMTRSFRSFAQIAFDEGVPLFRPREIGSSTESGVDFLYWKMAEQEEFTPPFDEIRVEVEDAWRMLEARKLAEARAAELQKAAAERPGPLSEALPDYADRVFPTNDFTWLTPGNIGFNPFAQPTLGTVEGVEGVSWDFMESVFRLREGEVGTAHNGPQDTFFVARAVRRSPADERQRQAFLQAFRMGGIQDIFPLQQDEQRSYYQRWYQDLEEEMKVSWKRPADQMPR